MKRFLVPFLIAMAIPNDVHAQWLGYKEDLFYLECSFPGDSRITQYHVNPVLEKVEVHREAYGGGYFIKPPLRYGSDKVSVKPGFIRIRRSSLTVRIDRYTGQLIEAYDDGKYYEDEYCKKVEGPDKKWPKRETLF